MRDFYDALHAEFVGGSDGSLRKDFEMGRIKDLTGHRFGRLTVIQIAGVRSVTVGGQRRAYWLCRCTCGGAAEVASNSLTTGNTSSCGCLHTEAVVARNRVGSRGVKRHPLYAVWNGMRARCNSPMATDYAIYGGRGVRVCDRWNDFFCFVEDMGPRPPGSTIDRRDGDKDYSPENCRWATAVQQARNMRTNKTVELDGRRRCISEWSEITGIAAATIAARLRRGWTGCAALTTPPRTPART